MNACRKRRLDGDGGPLNNINLLSKKLEIGKKCFSQGQKKKKNCGDNLNLIPDCHPNLYVCTLTALTLFKFFRIC